MKKQPASCLIFTSLRNHSGRRISFQNLDRFIVFAQDLIELRQICLHPVKPRFNLIESTLIEKNSEENHQNWYSDGQRELRSALHPNPPVSASIVLQT
jgi:hypothetical protein